MGVVGMVGMVGHTLETNTMVLVFGGIGLICLIQPFYDHRKLIGICLFTVSLIPYRIRQLAPGIPERGYLVLFADNYLVNSAYGFFVAH